MTRVTNNTFFDRAFRDFRGAQVDIAKFQAQIGSGKKLIRPSDDPSATAQVLNLNEALSRIDRYQRNATLANQRLALEDVTLASVGDLLIRAKEQALAANSGTQTHETRRAFGAEIAQRLDELIDLANVQDANGDYLFGGFQVETEPFSSTASGVVYNGSDGVRELQVSASRRVSTGDNGADVFMRTPGGNGHFAVSANAANTGTGVITVGSVVDISAFTHHDYSIQFTSPTTFDVIDTTAGSTVLAAQPYTDDASIVFDGIETSISGTPATGDRFDVAPSPAVSVFSTLQEFVDAMAVSPRTAAQQAQLDQRMNGVIASLDQSLNHVLETRTTVGARQNALDAVEVEMEDLGFELKSSISELEDVALDEAISSLQQRISAYEAAQATFVRLAGLSLFNFLS